MIRRRFIYSLRARLLVLFSLVLLITLVMQYFLSQQARQERERLLSQQEQALASAIAFGFRAFISTDYMDLLIDKENPALLEVGDFRQPAEFVAKLRDKSDPVSKYLYSQFSPELKSSLDQSRPGLTEAGLLEMLCSNLNTILSEDSSLYNEARFAEVSLSPETNKILSQESVRKDSRRRIRLNRLLLNDAYPNYFVSLLAETPLFYTTKNEKDPNCIENCEFDVTPGRIKNIFIIDDKQLVYDSLQFRVEGSKKLYKDPGPWLLNSQLDTDFLCQINSTEQQLEFDASHDANGETIGFFQKIKYIALTAEEVRLPGIVNYDQTRVSLQKSFHEETLPAWLEQYSSKKVSVPPVGAERSVVIPLPLDPQTKGVAGTAGKDGKKVVWYMVVVLEAIQQQQSNWQSFEEPLALPIVLLVALLLVTGTVWRFTKPIALLSEGARRIAEGDFGVRVPIGNERNEMGQLAASFNDMSVQLERTRELEMQLNQAERSAVVGRLASAIAHEIRNPLTYINLTLDHFRTSLAPEDPKKRETFERLAIQLKSEVSRINKHITELLNYARPARLNLQPLDLQEEATDAMHLVEAQAEEKAIVTSVRQSRDVPLVLADREWLRSIMTNLLINSVQATNGHGGNLSVVIHKDDVKPLVYIDIIDTGAGIPDEDLPKIFEPYFSTKETGTGLGLAIVKKAVEEHGGEIHVKSQLGQGTTFTIILPSTRNTEFD